MSIICTGSIAYDYLMSFPGYFKDHIIPDKLDSISLSFLVDSMVRQRGGTAPNIAYNLALLGEKPKLMGTVGEDFDDYGAWLRNNGVDTSLVEVIDGVYTASFFANTDLSNNQIASFYTGAMAYAKDLSIKNLVKSDVDLVVISPNDPTAMAKYAQECEELNFPYLYDPGQQVVRNAPDDIRDGIIGAQSLFINEYEFELIQKHTGMSAEAIRNEVEFVVITCGECGSDIWVKDNHFKIPAVAPKKVADPTGVGDAFRGGFLRGQRLGLDWQTCGQMGALAATYCLENRGTQNHTYTHLEFVQRYRENFDDQGALDILI
ncbi:carbohydrate kinase family protein [Pelolinea submarina]|uniref:Adenosine kinase n=1 Tax=Pelolinea submarina TaxID=913107 RepID=A0A347ZUE5_9CHLR|nr:carbohydrate kinase family protein [Pelolinea submarina]REG10488.1 adenosine kinase [Pelolinea submarina]BBB48926.1 adenosine kinase [Pelolinea submarina]